MFKLSTPTFYCLLLLLLLVFTESVWAEVYKCKNAQGEISYTDQKCSESTETLQVKENIKSVSNSVSASAKVIASPTHSSSNVTINAVQTDDKFAFKYPPKPTHVHWFVDMAEMIDESSAKVIDQTVKKLWQEKTIPLYVVTIASLKSMNAEHFSLENYATALFNTWGIGSQSHNNGMLLLISQGDRRVRIELGKEWGHQYDQKMQEVINTLITPAFKQSHYSIGIVEGVSGMNNVVRGLALPQAQKPWWYYPLIVIVVLILIGSLFFSSSTNNYYGRPRRRSGYYRDYQNNDHSNSSNGFDGGSSNGGGASGDW